MAIVKVAGKFQVVLDSGAVFELTLDPWSGRGQQIDTTEIGSLFGERIQRSFDALTTSEVATMRSKLAAAEASAERAAIEKAAESIPDKSPHVPMGFRDESVTERPRRGRPPKGE